MWINLLQNTSIPFQSSVCVAASCLPKLNMGGLYKSPAKIARSLLRSQEYKKAMLEDMWDCNITIKKETKDLIWNVSDCLQLTLKRNVTIVEPWEFRNPEFSTLPLSKKLTSFQNMWETDANSFTLFSSLHQHFRNNSQQCDHF